MIWITGTGYGICLRRNLIIVFFTVNHLRAIGSNRQRMQGTSRSAQVPGQCNAATMASAQRKPRIGSKALETSHLRSCGLLSIACNAAAMRCLQAASVRQPGTGTRQASKLSDADKAPSTKRQLRKPCVPACPGTHSRHRDMQAKKRPHKAAVRLDARSLSARHLPVPMHRHWHQAVLPARRHRPARARTANPGRRHLR